MAIEGDVILGVSDSEAEELDTGGDAVLGVSDDESPHSAGASRIGRPRPAPTVGEFGAWLLDAPYKPGRSVAADSSRFAESAARPLVVGLAIFRWSYYRRDGVNDADGGAASSSGDRGTLAQHWGDIEYEVLRSWLLQAPAPLPEGEGDAAYWFDLADAFGEAPLREPRSGDVRNVLRTETVVFNEALHVPQVGCDSAAIDEPCIWRLAPLTGRTNHARLVQDHPRRSAILRWRSEAGARRLPRRGAADYDENLRLEYEKVLLELPSNSSSSTGQPRRGRTSGKAEVDPTVFGAGVGVCDVLKENLRI